MDSRDPGAFSKLHPVETKRASEAIYEQVKELIFSGELKPGDRLPSERNMMDLFQRSRPTIREALRMLERSGYIRAIPGSNGAVVLAPDNKHLEENMADALQVGTITLAELGEYRMASEVATVAWAAQRRTEEDLEAMRAVLAEMETSLDRFEAFISLDPQFHGLLAQAAKNKVSAVMNRTLSKLNRSFMLKQHKASQKERQAMCRRIYQMHQAIYDAVAAGDPEQARTAMEAHMQAFTADLQEN